MLAPRPLIQNESIDIINTLWNYQTDGLKEIEADDARLPIWRKVAEIISKAASILAFGGALGAALISLSTFTFTAPILIGGTIGLLLGFTAWKVAEWAANAPYFLELFANGMKCLKESIFVVDRTLPRLAVIISINKQIDKVVTCLQAGDAEAKAEDGKQYLRLFSKMPKNQVIKSLKTTSVVLNLLIAIQFIQRDKKIDDGIRKHIAQAREVVHESLFTPECKKQVKAVSDYLEKTDKILQRDNYDPKLSDIDELFKEASKI